MKFVITETPNLYGMDHSKELKYVPEGVEVVIARYDPNGDNTEFIKAIEDADAILNCYVYFGKELIDHLKNCKVISFQSTGFNEVDLDYATEKGIAVASILDYCTQETAENAFAMMLALQRKTLLYNRQIQVDHFWKAQTQGKLYRIEGQTIGIVGLGRIGRSVAKKAHGFDMNVIAYDPFIPEDVAASVGAKLVDFDTLLAEADVVSIHMALTDDNVHMFNKETFKKMKKQPIIINEGRGPMISDADLAWALDEGLVRAAGLDMLESEFPDAEYIKNSPLIGRDNVILNPHSGFLSETSLELISKIPVDNAVLCCQGRHAEAGIVRNGIGL